MNFVRHTLAVTLLASCAATGCAPNTTVSPTPGASATATPAGTSPAASPGANSPSATPAAASVTVTGWTDVVKTSSVAHFVVDDAGTIWTIGGNSNLHKLTAGATAFAPDSDEFYTSVTRSVAGDIYAGMLPTGISKLAKGAASWTTVGAGVAATVLQADGTGAVYASTNQITGGAGHKLARLSPGTDTWTPVPVSAAIKQTNFRSPTMDAAGNVYFVGSEGELFKATGGGEPTLVSRGGYVATYTDKEGNVYAAEAITGKCMKLAPGATEWKPTSQAGGKGAVSVTPCFVEDTAGNLYNTLGAEIMKLAAGSDTWTVLSTIPTSEDDPADATHLALDSANRLYVGYTTRQSKGGILRAKP